MCVCVVSVKIFKTWARARADCGREKYLEQIHNKRSKFVFQILCRRRATLRSTVRKAYAIRRTGSPNQITTTAAPYHKRGGNDDDDDHRVVAASRYIYSNSNWVMLLLAAAGSLCATSRRRRRRCLCVYWKYFKFMFYDLVRTYYANGAATGETRNHQNARASCSQIYVYKI